MMSMYSRVGWNDFKTKAENNFNCKNQPTATCADSLLTYADITDKYA